MDTSALIALWPWEWARIVVTLGACCKLEFKIPPGVRAEYMRFWGSRNGRRVALAGGMSRDKRIARMKGPRDLSPPETLLAAALISNGIARVGRHSVGEVEALAYSLIEGGHALSNDEDAVPALPLSFRDTLRDLGPDVPGAEALRAKISQRKFEAFWSTSSAPLMLGCEAGLGDLTMLKKVMEAQSSAEQVAPPEIRKFVKEKDPKARRAMLRRQPGFWRELYTGYEEIPAAAAPSAEVPPQALGLA